MKTFLALVIIGIALSSRAEQSEYGQLNSKAVKLFSEGKHDEALAAGEEALKVAEQTLSPDDKDILTIMENLASMYDGAKKSDKALEIYERVLAIKEKDPATEPASKARTLFSLGDIRLDQKNWPAADGYFRRCLEIREKADPDSNDTAITLNRLSWVLQNEDKYAEEASVLQRVIATWEKTKGPDAAELGGPLYNLAFISEKLKRKADVERNYKRALDIRRSHPGEKDADLIMTMQALATYYREEEKLKSAEPLYKELLTLEEKNFGKENPELLPTLRGYLAVVSDEKNERGGGYKGLNKKNVADALRKRIKRLEPLEEKEDETSKKPTNEPAKGKKSSD
jgi:tetratricopeptide (TPR) repeat protein